MIITFVEYWRIRAGSDQPGMISETQNIEVTPPWSQHPAQALQSTANSDRLLPAGLARHQRCHILGHLHYRQWNQKNSFTALFCLAESVQNARPHLDVASDSDVECSTTYTKRRPAWIWNLLPAVEWRYVKPHVKWRKSQVSEYIFNCITAAIEQ